MKITVQFNKEYCEKNLKDTEDTCVEIENAETFGSAPNSDGGIVEIAGGDDMRLYSKPSASSKERSPLEGEKANRLRYRLRDTESVGIEADGKDLAEIEKLKGDNKMVGGVVEIRHLLGEGRTVTHVGYVAQNGTEEITLTYEKDDFWGGFRNEQQKIKWDGVVKARILK